MKVEVSKEIQGAIPSNCMKSGQIGVVVNNEAWEGTIVMKIYDGIVNLNVPNITWLDGHNEIQVRVFPKGTVVTLTTED